MMQNRTHTCGELRLSDAGKQVKISGWMENVRVVSANLAFVVVRDFYGTTQVVAETEDMVNTFKAITKESTISVEGVVRERDSKTGKMATGDIEIVPAKVEVLGRCQHSELPFQINRSREADEAQRLKYRYLDLRNPAVKKNIILRCNVVAALRKSMTEHGFLEITTPILTASSPEGARDYLVPARKHPGKFYALPQAADDLRLRPLLPDRPLLPGRGRPCGPLPRRVLSVGYGDGFCHAGGRVRRAGGRAASHLRQVRHL